MSPGGPGEDHYKAFKQTFEDLSKAFKRPLKGLQRTLKSL